MTDNSFTQFDPNIHVRQKLTAKELGHENAKLATRIGRQRKVIRNQSATIKKYHERHEQDVKLFNRLAAEMNAAREQIQRLINSGHTN